MGYVGWIGTFQGLRGDPRFKTEESELTRELRNLGAVLYCKTAVPTTLMAGETINNIIGYTCNPRNRLLSSGGSSGGEGSLIALRGSPAGFGTDIGGSVRSPPGFNFLYGVKPSSGRMPYQGAANSIDGQSTILSVIGSIAPTARSVTMLFKAVLSQQPWLHDPLVLEIPWRDDHVQEIRSLIEKAKTQKPGLAFGILRYDGVSRLHPPIARGLRLVEEILNRLGHKTIPWEPPSHTEAHELAVCTYTSFFYYHDHKSNWKIGPNIRHGRRHKHPIPSRSIRRNARRADHRRTKRHPIQRIRDCSLERRQARVPETVHGLLE